MTKQLHDTKRNKDDVLSYVKSILEDSKTRMIDLHRDWALSLAWVRGQQNVDFDSKSRKWLKSKTNPWQNRLIANMLLPIVRNKVARSMIFRNVWDAIPATPDQEDIEIAKVSTKILEDIWVKHKMPMILLRTLFWRSITGNGFIKVGWDKDAGDSVQVETRLIEDETLQQFMAMIGFDETPETVEVKPGELFLNVVSPFNLTFDPLAMMVEDSEIAIESNLRSLDWIVQKYGNKWKKLLSENIDTEQLISPWIYQNNNESINKKGVLVHELYIKPRGRFEK